MRRSCVIAAAMLLALGGSARAQTRGRAPRPTPSRPAPAPSPFSERVRIVVGGGALVNPQRVNQDFTLTKNVENTPVTTDLKPGVGGFIEGGARVRVTRMLWVGAVGFAGSGTADGSIAASVPHPFYFNQPRDISGDLKRLSNSVKGIHVELAYPVSMSRGREITVFGGPSYIDVTQTLVTDFTYTDEYPFDTATFQSATTSRAAKGGIGFNAGGEITWRLNRSTRFGAMVRYSLANITLSPAAGNNVDVRAGGVQVGAGVQILIQKRPPRPPRPARPAPPARRR